MIESVAVSQTEALSHHGCTLYPIVREKYKIKTSKPVVPCNWMCRVSWPQTQKVIHTQDVDNAIVLGHILHGISFKEIWIQPLQGKEAIPFN